jgi:regulator of sirC expression with transglutaminase-like and TPR domain
MAASIKESLAPDADAAARLAALNKYLFVENGFHGSRFEYEHRANSYLNRVIDDREGLPITLSVLYMELGRRLQLAILGVGLPGHFVVKQVATDGAEQLIDVFDGGRFLTREDAEKIVRNFGGQELREEHLHASTPSEILQRMLRNLLGNAQRRDDKEALLRYLDALLAINPGLAQERGMRAVVRFETGRRDAAIADLDWFLEHKPAGLDLDGIRQMQEYFRQGKR